MKVKKIHEGSYRLEHWFIHKVNSSHWYASKGAERLIASSKKELVSLVEAELKK